MIKQPLTKPLLAAHAAKRMAKHDSRRAAKWLASALQEFPDHPVLTTVRSSLSRMSVPPWHIPMMKDTLRNQAYQVALAQLIRPATRVFEIGTGAGLLAMMAARAGAQHIVTCEANESIAKVAEKIIQDNGFSNRITIIPKKSTAISADEIGGPCDLLVTETFDTTLIGEGALPSIKQAKKNLLRANGAICPTRSWLRAQLVQRNVSSFDITQPIEGFDLSAFATFEPRGMHLKSDDPKLIPVGPVATVSEYDFTTDFELSPCELTLSFHPGESSFDGVAFWMGLELAPGVTYECPPGAGRASHWGTFCLLKPAHMRRANPAEVTVRVAIDVDMFEAWFDPSPGAG